MRWIILFWLLPVIFNFIAMRQSYKDSGKPIGMIDYLLVFCPVINLLVTVCMVFLGVREYLKNR